MSYDITPDAERVRAAFQRGDTNIPVILRTKYVCPGDIAVFTALIRDIHRCYPGRFLTDARVDETPDGHNQWVILGNPHLTNLKDHGDTVPTLSMEYGQLVNRCNQDGRHFIWGYFDCFNQLVGTQVKLTEFRPDLHLTPDELGTAPAMSPDEPYWVLVAGGKEGYATKMWGWPRWAQVVAALRDRVKFVQVGAWYDIHEPVPFAVNAIGKTSLRELMGLIYYSSGVACGVTAAMHFAAGFNKPCVVAAYGGEPKHWECYDEAGRQRNAPDDHRLDFVPHRYIASDWPCDRREKPGWGCWKSKVDAGKPDEHCGHLNQSVFVAGKDEHGADRKVLSRVPECMAAIPWKDVAEAIREEDGLVRVRTVRVKTVVKARAAGASWADIATAIRRDDQYARRFIETPMWTGQTIHVFANMGCRGGGEHSTITLMGALKAKGVRVEFWPLNRIDPSWELDLWRATDVVHDEWKPPERCMPGEGAYVMDGKLEPGGHMLIYANDQMPNICRNADYWKAVLAKMGSAQLVLNYQIADGWKQTWLVPTLVCVYFLNGTTEQSWKRRVTGNALSAVPTVVLPPATRLDSFLEIERA